MIRPKIIVGPPGTGKTTYMMNVVEEEIKNGVDPDKILYCSFTKKAVEEAASRACKRFKLSKTDMRYFKTIHALAFMCMGIGRDNVMKSSDYLSIGDHLGIEFTDRGDMFITDGPVFKTRNNGDFYSFIDGFSRARKIPGQEVWDMLDHDGLNWYEYLRYSETVVEYKREKHMFDFSDMLEVECSPLDIKVAIIDEAQDLSTAQWDFLERIISKAERVYIAGDDDQAIYQWSGADVDRFVALDGDIKVLNKSYRIPNKVLELSSCISSKISYRKDKDYFSKGTDGSLEYWNGVDNIDMSDGSWLLLARNSYLLGELTASVRNMGFPYAVRGKSSITTETVKVIRLWEQHRKGKQITEAEKSVISKYTQGVFDTSKIWHEAFTGMKDVDYYVSLLRRGESITNKPRIDISTIHGAKGGEADNVVLVTDMAYSTWSATKYNADAELRVWYVGVTRAKENLHIIMPRGRYCFEL
jgi:DNA helicase-2/ATP-dependent DNA helicase PcrA